MLSISENRNQVSIMVEVPKVEKLWLWRRRL